MRANPLLKIQQALNPSQRTRDLIKNNLKERLIATYALKQVAKAATPSPKIKQQIWQKVAASLRPAGAINVLDKLAEILTPLAQTRASWRRSILNSLPQFNPFPSFSVPTLKWAAAFVIIGFCVRITPIFFIVPPIEAETAVLLLPPQGEAELNINNSWIELTEGFELDPGMRIRTQDGQVTILFHEYGVIRLDRHTTITLHETSNYLKPAAALLPSLTLEHGRLWFQGFIPSHLRGFTIQTNEGLVTVHEGSVSIMQNQGVLVEVLDRRASVSDISSTLHLISGEYARLNQSPLRNYYLNPSIYKLDWYRTNLAKDSAHRSEIADIQKRRLEDQAGILPTSSLYPVKRIAEKVDDFFTLGEEAKIQNQLLWAQTRLSEAAALLANGEETATVSATLDEYKAKLNSLEKNRGDMVTKFLLQENLASANADLAALEPNDASYLIKKAVLEASSAVGDTISTQDLYNTIVLDAVEVLKAAIEEGENEGITTTWESLQEHLKDTGEPTEDNPFARELEQKLADLAKTVESQQSNGIEFEPEFLTSIAGHTPVTEVKVTLLNEAQTQMIINGITDRVLINLTQNRSRINQLKTELKALRPLPARTRLYILRRLLQEFEEDLNAVVRVELRKARLQTVS